MNAPRAISLVYSTLLAAGLPAYGIVIPGVVTGGGQNTNPAYYLAPYNDIRDGVNLNGVVWLNIGGSICSGAVVNPTQVLTAAHCMNGASPVVNLISDTNSLIALTSTSYVVDPDYTDFSSGADLAVVNLSSAVPLYTTIYSLFAGAYGSGSMVTLAGFGYTGTGDTGETSFDLVRRWGHNSYEADGSLLGISTKIIVGDFDNGLEAQNVLTGSSLGYDDEVDIGHGDSGGPTFYNGQIIGIHDIIECWADQHGFCTVPPSVFASNGPNSFYGELFGDTSVQGNAEWLETVITPEPATGLLLSLTMIPILALKARRRS